MAHVANGYPVQRGRRPGGHGLQPWRGFRPPGRPANLNRPGGNRYQAPPLPANDNRPPPRPGSPLPARPPLPGTGMWRGLAFALGRTLPWFSAALLAYELWRLYQEYYGQDMRMWRAPVQGLEAAGWSRDTVAGNCNRPDLFQSRGLPSSCAGPQLRLISAEGNQLHGPAGGFFRTSFWAGQTPWPATGPTHYRDMPSSRWRIAVAEWNAEWPAPPRFDIAPGHAPLERPWPWPNADPMQWPPGAPAPWPVAPPVRPAPRPGTNPWRDPVEQPNLRPRPRRRPPRRIEYPRIDFSPGQRPRIRPRIDPRPRPPRGPERKALVFGFRPWLSWFMSPTSEWADVVESLFDALPQRRRRSCNLRGLSWEACIVENFNQINLREALENLLTNEVEDQVIGRLGRGIRNALRRNPWWVKPVGPGTGPAL